MAALRRFLRRVLNALAPGRAERERAREVAAHLAVLEDEYRRRGLSGNDARRAARRAFGPESNNDRQRDARSFVWLDDLRRDLAYALRTLGRSPGFTSVTILTLALAIGASTAIFAIVDHVLVRDLPAPQADRLVRLFSSNPERGRGDASIPDVIDWRAAATSFDFITAFGGTSATLTGAVEPEQLTGMLVGPDFFTMTGVRLALGRPFAPDDYLSSTNAGLGALVVKATGPGGPASIVLSDALWHRQFGADPGVVGRHVQLNDVDTVVAGVMPAGFRFNESSWGEADFWAPLVESSLALQRRYRQFTTIARLTPGATVAAAQAEMTVIASSLERAHPKDDGKWTVDVEPLKASMTSEVAPTLLILAGGVGCVLLVACANVAGLLIVRANGRRRDVALRLAIGAGRGRLMRQWLTESTIVAVAGGLAGFVLAVWAVPVLSAYAPGDLPRLAEIAIDARAFAFSLVLSIATGVCCGAIPALGLGRAGTDVLRSAVAVGGGRRRWLRPALVVGQVGLAVVLLVGAGLMARSLLAVKALDLGFDPHHVLTFGVNLRPSRYQTLTANRAFTRDFAARLAALPGVAAAGNGMFPLLGGVSASFVTEGREVPIDSALDVASPGYFRALDYHLHAGRFFAETDDDGGAPVAVVNRAFARTAWGTSDAVGRRLRSEGSDRWITVVGVVEDTRRSSLEEAPPPLVYLPYQQSRIATSSNFVVRTAGPPADALPLVRDLVRQIDPSLAVSRIATMDERVAKFVVPRQFNLWLIGLFSAIAFVLAVVGIYGLVAELVATRTPEIGVRMALGANRAQIVRLVTGGTVLVTAAGLAVGLAGAALAARSLGSMIFGVTPLDPVTLGAVPAALLGASAVAGAFPVRRATRVDPVVALRRD